MKKRFYNKFEKSNKSPRRNVRGILEGNGRKKNDEKKKSEKSIMVLDGVLVNEFEEGLRETS